MLTLKYYFYKILFLVIKRDREIIVLATGFEQHPPSDTIGHNFSETLVM